jgi:hypothetical protein
VVAGNRSPAHTFWTFHSYPFTISRYAIRLERARTGQAREKSMHTPQSTPAIAVLGRLGWMLFGPFVLFLTGYALFTRHGGTFGALDACYFGGLALMLWGRWVENRSGFGTSATGEPLTDVELRRYMLVAAVIVLAVWGVSAAVRLGGLTG